MFMVEHKLSRREFFYGSGLIVGSIILDVGCSNLQFPQPKEQILLKSLQSLYDIYGIHDTPNVGGSFDLTLFEQDIWRLKPRWVTFTSPSSRLLRFSQAANLSVISRIYQKDNYFNAQLIKNEASKAFEFIKDPFLVPFNEVNLLEETGGISLSPEEHILKHFLPSVDLISKIAENYQKRAQILITPLAQRAPNEEAYFAKMLQSLKPYLNRFNCDFALGLHAYIFEEDEDPLQYIKDRYSMSQSILGVDLPIFVTEGGLYQTVEKGFSDEIVAKQTCKILKTSILTDLPIKAYILWLLSNYAQRPMEHRNKILDDYEQAALRKSTRITEAYVKIAAFTARPGETLATF